MVSDNQKAIYFPLPECISWIVGLATVFSYYCFFLCNPGVMNECIEPKIFIILSDDGGADGWL
jgi:hypothetical protein